MSDDQESQDEELLALQAIFSEADYLKLNTKKFKQLLSFNSSSSTDETPDEESDVHSCRSEGSDQLMNSGDFSAVVQLCETFCIKDYQDENESAAVRFLPPIVLGFELPADYPSQSPPKINLSCKWLRPSQLSKLIRRLDELWVENQYQPILYIWCDFLQQDSMKYLSLWMLLEIKGTDDEDATDNRVIQDLASPKLLFNFLVDYNKQQLKLEFERSTWSCTVCFDDKPGSDSFKFYNCGHIYCKGCMTSHFSLRIEEGDVKALTCPESKCESQGHPSQLKDLLSAELYERYERLLLQTTLDNMLDVTYCPRTFCQTAVLLDPGDSMGSCSACNFVFCSHCKMSYHGIHPCNIRSAKLKEKLEDASAEDMQAYKEQYGKLFVEALISECKTYTWIDKNCEPCPVCSCKITKGDGCNKMTCTKCKAFFCWLCKAVLPRANPYMHYRNNPNCHLFPGEDDVDVVFDDVEDEEMMGLG